MNLKTECNDSHTDGNRFRKGDGAAISSEKVRGCG
jgi:hypothetical protein